MSAEPVSRIGRRTFTESDQERFALWSLDRNPMHMDAVAARRLITGRQVVHGIHVLLSALELWRNEQSRPPAQVSCTFANPISVGDEVEFSQSTREDGNVAIEATVNGLSCARVLLELSAVPAVKTSSGSAAEPLEPLAAPLDMPPAQHAGKTYRLTLPTSAIGAAFPRCVSYFGAQGVAAIAALSYFVGMVCPGLHSIFSSLSFAPDDKNAAHLDVSVRKYDERVRLFDIAYDGALRGSLKAFLRAPPQEQATVQELRASVAAGEFRGTRSLVIGGSRGLGELTAKILAAGGGDVVVSYASGVDDARKVQGDIKQSGGAKCELLQLDLTRARFAEMDFDWRSLSAVYFFATPRIYQKRNDIFAAPAFAEFVDFYIGKFFELCQRLEACAPEQKIKVFFPSSVFVTDRPKGMTEYAMAKAAGEVLVEDINRSFKHVWVQSNRLPRLSTDQTASILKVSTQSNLGTLLPVIRAFMGANA